MDRGGNTYYYQYDGLGSVTEVTDGTGAVVESYTYDAYGNPSVTSSLIDNPYMFTGRRWDTESDTFYYRARQYDSSIGRFLQRDPIGYYDSLNLYQYVGNNPGNWVDPYGLFALEVVWITVVIPIIAVVGYICTPAGQKAIWGTMDLLLKIPVYFSRDNYDRNNDPKKQPDKTRPKKEPKNPPKPKPVDPKKNPPPDVTKPKPDKQWWKDLIDRLGDLFGNAEGFGR